MTAAPPASHATLGTPSNAEDEEEAPFQLVRTRRRPQRSTANKTYSSSNGAFTGPSSGFAYASSSASRRRGAKAKVNGGVEAEEEEEARRAVHRACEAVDVFVRYLGSELGSAGAKDGERPTYAQQLAATLSSIWPAPIAIPSNLTDDERIPLRRTRPEATSLDSTRSSETRSKQHSSSATQDGCSQSTARPRAIVPTRIVCLGLGSPCTSRSAQIQLALLVVVRKWLAMLHASRSSTTGADGGGEEDLTENEGAEGVERVGVECVAYDPVFSSGDRSVLHTYGVLVASAPSSPSSPSSSNPIDAYYTAPLTHPTLLYMPHCDRTLYETTLTLSSPAHTHTRLILLSNMLANYALTANLATASPTLHALIPRFAVAALPNCAADKRGLLVHERMREDVRADIARFVRLWDRNALRDLGFHWVETLE
ncbi:uncharacterized protein SRS1_14736 [Sporisorium reilianum f. sp. reilianum]|uniref:SRR1-like domain-containing protein n=1 Tax=Sporisorium reilianum f. sp. reilianum TaxID=72559 RepID=A0A2N8UGW6_9BASI|nr:uncharacterized protein SRS1_14736 [Sporisorium reilianum f. sp. reilianum]